MEGLQRIDELVELKIIDKKTVDFLWPPLCFYIF